MAKILVFGDSISWGAFDKEFGGWVERLKIHFLQSYKDKEIGVYNFSVASNDTKNTLKFLESDIEKINTIEPEELILVFSIGSNDFRYIDSEKNIVVPKKEFEENLKKIISISKKYSNQIIFTGFSLIDETKTMPWNENEYWDMKSFVIYEDILKNICKEKEVYFIPLFDLLTNKDLDDGLHPNSEGHRKIFKKVKDELNKILKINQ